MDSKSSMINFFLKYNGKYIDHDGVFGPQCTDTIKQYFKEVLKREPIKGNAIDYYLKDIPGFEKIANKWISWPQPGDIIVWGSGVGVNGHIAVCNWSRSFDFGGFEQNWPIGSPCHYQEHTYKNVLGWLRPIAIAPVETPGVPITYRIGYLSDVDDIGPAVAGANEKIKEFSKGALQLAYTFIRTTAVNAPAGQALSQDTCWQMVDRYAKKEMDAPHGFVFGYNGSANGAWYHTATTGVGNLYSAGQKVWPADCLLFEMKHQMVMFYNHYRGSNPWIENVDNYTGGEAIVQAQIKQLLPYVQVFKEHQWYN